MTDHIDNCQSQGDNSTFAAAPVNAVEPLLKRVYMFLEDSDWASADVYCEKVLDIEPENIKAYLGKLMAELKVHKLEELADCENEADIQNSNNYKRVCQFDKTLEAELQGYINVIKIRNENKRVIGIYERARDKMKAARSEGDYKDAARLFESVADHKDSAELAHECYEKAEISRKNEILRDANNNMNSLYPQQWECAVKLYKSIPGWKDADTKAEECEKKIAERLAQEEVARKEAVKQAKQKKATAIRLAVVACVVVALLYVVITVIIPNHKYNTAVELMNEGKYSEALVVFNEIQTHKDSAELIVACKYDVAVSLMNQGRYSDAYDTFLDLNGYKDSIAKAKSIFDKAQLEKRAEATVGDYFFFGTYEQDNDTSNGKEPIEWLVLDKQNDRLLIISKYALDVQAFDTSGRGLPWRSCSLREWLNNAFLKEAFNNTEKAMIPTVTVRTESSSHFGTSGGGAAEDKVFVLSYQEAEKYFVSDDARKCTETAYAASKIRYSSDRGEWWLRTKGQLSFMVTGVWDSGKLYYVGFGCDSEISVRPALWIQVGK